MNEALVLTEIDPAGFALVTLNRPAALNALSRALRSELCQRSSGSCSTQPSCGKCLHRLFIGLGRGKGFCFGGSGGQGHVFYLRA